MIIKAIYKWSINKTNWKRTRLEVNTSVTSYQDRTLIKMERLGGRNCIIYWCKQWMKKLNHGQGHLNWKVDKMKWVEADQHLWNKKREEEFIQTFKVMVMGIQKLEYRHLLMQVMASHWVCNRINILTLEETIYLNLWKTSLRK
jgi:hypothetical protein